MKKIIVLVTLFLTFQVFSTEKYALIIAVGDYPAKGGWSSISSKNDVPLIKQALLVQGFNETNITTMVDEQATKSGIIEAITALQSKIKEGDIVVIHYSGHGQQVFDDNEDEVDGLDEALVPYDAFAKYTHNYKGQNHLRDDQLGNIFANLRNVLGNEGQLLVILDSCHSGSATRGGKTRGGEGALVPSDWKKPNQSEANKGSELLERTQLKNDAAPFVIISGASADELNYEYDGVGSLSYAFSKSMNELGSDFTYRQLFSSIASNMNSIAPKQKPTIEGDIDYKLFKGEYVKQQDYFQVNRVLRSNTVLNINGGQVNRIFENTTVFVLPSGSSKVETSKILSKGKVTVSKLGESTIVLDKALNNDNAKDYWVFIDQPSFGNISVNVFFDNSVTDVSIQNGITEFLQQNNLGTIVTTLNSADIIIDKKANDYVLSFTKGENEFGQLTATRGDVLDEIKNKIFNYAQGTYLKNLSFKNNAYEFDFKLIPIEFDYSTGMVGNLLPEDNYIESGVFKVRPEEDFVVLQVSNKSKKPLYISLVEINSAGEINPFFPSDGCTLNSNERRLAPGQTMVFKDCVYSFGPPYERLIIKGFASDEPLDFQSTVTTRGQNGTSKNPLESFLQSTYQHSRGGTGTTITGTMNGYSTEFVYDIVE